MRFVLFLFISLLIIVIAIRAWTLSMTWDEAYTVCVYATDGQKIFSPKDFLPNNHVLHTILVWFMFQAAPWQEGALRFPAFLGGIGTILILRQLGFFLFNSPTTETKYREYWNTIFLLALVSLHPLVFQFFSFARGYSLSLFFSLFGFYSLLRVFQSNFNQYWLLVSGISFGLSVASNLTATFMNSAIIFTAFCLWLCLCTEKRKVILPLIFRFCLPGALIVLVLYAPFLGSVPMGDFNYATETPLEGILDPISWTLGNSTIVAPESITRLILGIPIPEDLYWLLLTLTPFFIVLPILFTALIVALPMIKSMIKTKNKLCSNDLAILLVFGALLCYVVILCAAWNLGKTLFPKDRTGFLPITYSLMLPVLLLQYLEVNGVFRFGKRILLVGIVLLILHFLGLFGYPYYHNLWYGDADIREMMEKVRVLSKSSDPPKMLIFTSTNQTSIEFYMKKYKMSGLELRCILNKEAVNDLPQFPQHTIFILPAHEAKDALYRQSKSFRILQQNRYIGLMLAECQR